MVEIALLQLDAVLSRQSLRERSAGHRALLDEDLTQQPARLALLGQRPLQVLGGQKLVFDEDPPERAPGKVGSIHRS